MDFKRLRIAVLSTALLFATNTLAVTTQKANSKIESPQIFETQNRQEETLGHMV